MKYLMIFEDYKKWDWDDEYLYHYTSLTNSIIIIEDGFLRPSVTNGISLTESPEYHDEDHGGIPTNIRFVFSKDLLDKEYVLEPYNANDEEEENFVLNGGDLDDDLDRQRIQYFGNEYEFRVYEPINISYCVRVEYNYIINLPVSLSNICKEKGIEFGSFD